MKHNYCALFVALFVALSACTFYLKFCCVSPCSFVSKYSTAYCILKCINSMQKRAISLLRVYRKIATSAQTDGRIATDGRLYTDLGNCFFPVQVAEFQPLDTVKNYFTGAFQAFYTRTRSSHSKAFMYLKSLKTICEEVNLLCSWEMSTCKLTKKTLSNILLHVFCLHFLRMHDDYFFQRSFESVWAQFLSGNISGKEVKLLARCSFLVRYCSLLVSFCSLLVTFCSLLVTFCS